MSTTSRRWLGWSGDTMPSSAPSIRDGRIPKYMSNKSRARKPSSPVSRRRASSDFSSLAAPAAWRWSRGSSPSIYLSSPRNGSRDSSQHAKRSICCGRNRNWTGPFYRHLPICRQANARASFGLERTSCSRMRTVKAGFPPKIMRWPCWMRSKNLRMSGSASPSDIEERYKVR